MALLPIPLASAARSSAHLRRSSKCLRRQPGTNCDAHQHTHGNGNIHVSSNCHSHGNSYEREHAGTTYKHTHGDIRSDGNARTQCR